jgi:molybdopterin-synthase adenylyltransferase
MDLTDAQLERYARHIVLQDIGGVGQKKLLNAKVLVIGAGGLGAPCLQYLAAAGVGTLGIIDDDVVDLSNLQRQVIHRTSDIGGAKVASAVRAIADINPDIRIVSHQVRMTSENAAQIIANYDIVADGSDSFETRFIVHGACLDLKKPLISAAVGMFDGQISCFKGYLPQAPCYRCFVPDMPKFAAGTCSEMGVLGALTGVIGSMQALEVIREIVGFGQSLVGRILMYDAMEARVRIIGLTKDIECAHCGLSHD